MNNEMRRRAWRRWWRREGFFQLIVVAVVSAVFTLIQIHYSMDRGRLAQPPTYDDVGYFVDALNRLDAIYAQGWRQLLIGYVQSPPHSPWSSGMALAAFALLGIHTWAPYALNGLAVAGLLLCVGKLMSGTRLAYRVAAGVFVLTVPMTANLVTEFRPDMVWGFAAAMAIIMALREPLSGSSVGHRLATGAWLALALLAKPPAFPATASTVMLAWVMAFVCDRIETGSPLGWRAAGRSSGLLLAPVAVTALPHFILNAREIVHFIALNTVSTEAQTWEIPGGFKVQAGYYLLSGRAIGAGSGVPTGGWFMLDQHLFIISAAVGVALGVLIWKRRPGDRASRARGLRAMTLAGVTLVAYVAPTVIRAKNQFFGSEFHALLVLGSIAAVRMLIVNGPQWRVPRLGPMVLAGMTAWGLVEWRLPSVWNLSGDPMAVYNNRVVGSIDKVLFDRAARGARVFVMAGGMVSSNTLNFLTRQDGKRLDVVDLDLNSDLDPYRHEIDLADFVVAAEPGVAEFDPNHPSTKLLGTTLAMMRANPDFNMVLPVQSLSGKYFYVFERKPDFATWVTEENLDPIEGPYAEWNLPRVRWALYPATTLVFDTAEAGRFTLTASARAPMDDQAMSVFVDGRPIGRELFGLHDTFRDISLPMDLAAGRHRIELRFDKQPPTTGRDTRPRSVLFQRLRIDGPADVSGGESTTAPAGG